MLTKKETYEVWANNLTPEQARKVVIEWCDQMEVSETICFGETGNPYWSTSGDAVIDGQVCFKDE